jgi:hypothetical protein
MLFSEKDRLCSACQAGNQVGEHHPAKNILSSSRPLKLLHMDLFGPITYISISGNKYGLVIVDDFSHFTWVFFLQDKSEAKGVVNTLEEFKMSSSSRSRTKGVITAWSLGTLKLRSS